MTCDLCFVPADPQQIDFRNDYQQQWEQLANKKVRILQEVNAEKKSFWASLLEVMKTANKDFYFSSHYSGLSFCSLVGISTLRYLHLTWFGVYEKYCTLNIQFVFFLNDILVTCCKLMS